MEAKKTNFANIQNKRFLFLGIGLTFSLGLALLAFEWKTYDPTGIKDLGSYISDFDEEFDIPPTVIDPPKPPVISQPKLIEIPDDVEIDEEIPFEIDVETSEEMIVDEIILENDETAEETHDEIVFAEEQASFPGGREAWNKYLKKNLNYPRQAVRMGVQGYVYLSFVVNKEGKISDVQATRKIGGGCDEEAIRVLESSPNWNPGLQRGRPVKSRMAIRVQFTLK